VFRVAQFLHAIGLGRSSFMSAIMVITGLKSAPCEVVRAGTSQEELLLQRSCLVCSPGFPLGFAVIQEV